jgi:hypothetical protein
VIRGSQNLLNKLQACRCVQQGHFRRGYERKTVANWPDDLDVFGGQGRVFCNPYVIQRLNSSSKNSAKSLIFMAPPHGTEHVNFKMLKCAFLSIFSLLIALFRFAKPFSVLLYPVQEGG